MACEIQQPRESALRGPFPQILQPRTFPDKRLTVMILRSEACHPRSILSHESLARLFIGRSIGSLHMKGFLLKFYSRKIMW